MNHVAKPSHCADTASYDAMCPTCQREFDALMHAEAIKQDARTTHVYPSGARNAAANYVLSTRGR